MMHETIKEKINELRILRVKLNRIRCYNALEMRTIRFQYKELQEDNDQIDAIVARINKALDTYFKNCNEKEN
jgi:hypothetical protein